MRRVFVVFALVIMVGVGRVFAGVCDVNQYINNGQCTACVYNATCDGDVYRCDDGFYDGGNNECLACPPRSTCVSQTEFSCVPGTYLYNGACVTCVENATCAGGADSFHCNSGWYNDGTGCRSCDGHVCDGETLVSCGVGYFLYNWNGVYCSKCGDTLNCPVGTDIVTVSCKAGYYKSSYHCYQCPDEYWCPDSLATIDNYTQYCNPGYYQNGNGCVACPDGVVCPGHQEHNCPDELFWYDDGRCLAYAPGDPGVVPNCNPGFYDGGDACEKCPVENSNCSSEYDFDCVAGFYKNGDRCDVCPKYSTCPDASTQINCIPGYWLNGTKCTRCSGASYCNNNILHPCPEFTADSLDSVIPSGHRLVSGGDNVSAWSENGLYTSVKSCRLNGELLFEEPNGFYVKHGAIWDGEKYWANSTYWKWTDTPGRYLSSVYNTGSYIYYRKNLACTNAPENAVYTGAGAPDGNDCPWRCVDGYFRMGDVCTVCPPGLECRDGKIVCPMGQYAFGNSCQNCPEYYTARAPYNTAPQSINECQIMCDGGYWLATANSTRCEMVGAGFWNPENYTNYGSVGERNRCSDNLSTIGYGTGADSPNDCGKVLHIGKYSLWLHRDKRTRPSLAVQYGNYVLYGDMMQGVRSGTLNAEYDGAVYSVGTAVE